eukprot:TRINITY_DN3029_c0_g2_i17.p1 TRINITY_DN3029_c0_g2~~TRINITY_DN3029_c0_g2_i17.p1  ORF type:complete len:347 (-),score=89.23 TRINITY_DN3029_c0_g2_i17:128-1168(-)
MAKLQEKFPNVWKGSNTQKWGSKFVSVLAYDNEEGKPHMRCFQLSNQCAQLINEKVIRVSKKKENAFVVSKSNQKWTYPELECFYTTGEGDARTTTLRKTGNYLVGDDVLPYFVVTCPVTSPVSPDPMFTSFDFQATFNKYKKHGSWSMVRDQLEKASRETNHVLFIKKLHDFHFLLWIYVNNSSSDKSWLDVFTQFANKMITLDEQTRLTIYSSFSKILSLNDPGGKIFNSQERPRASPQQPRPQPSPQQPRQVTTNSPTIQQYQPQPQIQPRPQPSPQHPRQQGTINSPATQGGSFTDSQKSFEHKVQRLKAMGYSEDLVREILMAQGGDVNRAADILLEIHQF